MLYTQIAANGDRTTIVTWYLQSSLIAGFLRLYPQQWADNIAMKVEVLGKSVVGFNRKSIKAFILI
jgi:hypothetical protein